jgi:hypothetical protein
VGDIVTSARFLRENRIALRRSTHASQTGESACDRARDQRSGADQVCASSLFDRSSQQGCRSRR